jgi:hypothetical protein
MRKTYVPYENRNRIIHDPWYVTDAKAPAQFRAMPFKDPRFGIFEIDDNYITSNLESAANLLRQAEELEKKIKAELGT